MNIKLFRKTVNTVVGPMIIIASGKGLCFVEFQIPGRTDLLEKRLAKWYTKETIPDFIDEENEYISQAKTWLGYYFDKNFDKLDTPSLDVRGTDFELKIWEALKNIRLGQTMTYGELAGQMGKPGAARAVGNCTRRNPVSIIIPCHRVIGTNGSLTGYGGGLENKRLLLNHEGALLI